MRICVSHARHIIALSHETHADTRSHFRALSPPPLRQVRCPGCLRATYGVDTTRAVGYAALSASQASAMLKFFFPHAPLPPLKPEQSKAYVADHVSPTLTKGLMALCKAKPDKPVQWLAAWLIANNPNAPKA